MHNLEIKYIDGQIDTVNNAEEIFLMNNGNKINIPTENFVDDFIYRHYRTYWLVGKDFAYRLESKDVKCVTLVTQ